MEAILITGNSEVSETGFTGMIMHLMKNGVMSQLFPNEGTKLFSFVSPYFI